MLRPPEKIATTEWACKHRRLSAMGSATPGRCNPNITPWVFGMHEALDDPTVQKVVCMKSAQVAWRDGVLLNYIGKRIDVAPCPMAVVFPKEKTAKKFNLEKFGPMVEVTPRLSVILPVHVARDRNNLWDHKTFAGGFLKFVTSNAPGEVMSTPAPVVAVEEPDDANTNVRDQGDSITLLEERIKSHSGRWVARRPSTVCRASSRVTRLRISACIWRRALIAAKSMSWCGKTSHGARAPTSCTRSTAAHNGSRPATRARIAARSGASRCTYKKPGRSRVLSYG